jgi:hypothetical protein
VAASKYLNQIIERSGEINRPNRMTGDGLLNIVDELLSFKDKTKDPRPLQEVIETLIVDQSVNLKHEVLPLSQSASKKVRDLYDAMLSLVDGFKESI